MKLLGKEIATTGMGCWAIGGPFFNGDEPYGYTNSDDAESIRTLHAAVDSGVELFDTAAVYGAGHSERLIGKAFGNRDGLIIVSKMGMGFDEKSKQVLDNETSPDQVLPAIEASLRRLQRDHIVVLVLHLNDLSVETASPLFEQMEKARTAGKLRAYGWSTDFSESVDATASMDGFVAVEHAMNVVMDTPRMQNMVQKHDLAALIRSPLAMGVLTGKFDETSVIPDNDVRSLNHDWRFYFHDGKVPEKYLTNVNALRELLQTGGRTLAQGSLCWLLAKSPNNIPIPGARTVEQIRENAAAAEFGPLPASVMEEIETLIEREDEGPSRAR